MSAALAAFAAVAGVFCLIAAAVCAAAVCAGHAAAYTAPGWTLFAAGAALLAGVAAFVVHEVER